MNGMPTARYQCISRPGECKFEWNCGALCACWAKESGTEQEKNDMKESERRLKIWREETK